MLHLTVVLILVVVEDGLALLEFPGGCFEEYVLILVVVEDGLALMSTISVKIKSVAVLILVVVEDGLAHDLIKLL